MRLLNTGDALNVGYLKRKCTKSATETKISLTQYDTNAIKIINMFCDFYWLIAQTINRDETMFIKGAIIVPKGGLGIFSKIVQTHGRASLRWLLG